MRRGLLSGLRMLLRCCWRGCRGLPRVEKRRLLAAKEALGAKAVFLDDIMDDMCDFGLDDAYVKRRWGLDDWQFYLLSKLLL